MIENVEQHKSESEKLRRGARTKEKDIKEKLF